MRGRGWWALGLWAAGLEMGGAARNRAPGLGVLEIGNSRVLGWAEGGGFQYGA